MNTTNKTAVEEIETEIRMAMIGAKANPRTPKAEHYTNLLQMIEQALTQAQQQGERAAYQKVLDLADEMHTVIKLSETDGSEFNKGYIQYQDWVLDILKEVKTLQEPLVGKE